MPSPLRQLANERGAPVRFASQLLDRIRGLLKAEKAPPQEFIHQLQGKVPGGPLGLMFAETLQTQAPMTRESFLASANPPRWRAQKLRPQQPERPNPGVLADITWDNYMDRYGVRYDQAMQDAIDALSPREAADFALQALNHLKSQPDIPDDFIMEVASHSPTETLHLLQRGQRERGDLGYALQPVARRAEAQIRQSRLWQQLYREAEQTETEGLGETDYSEVQRIARLPQYFELGLSSPSHPWTQDPRVIERLQSKVDYPSEVSALMEEAQSHFPHYPNLIGHVRGSADPLTRTVAIEEVQADPLQSGVKHPTFHEAYGALAKMALQLAARRGYESFMFPTGDTVARVRAESARPAMRRIYDNELGDQLIRSLGQNPGIFPKSLLSPPEVGPGFWWQYDLRDPEIRRAVSESLPHFASGGVA